MTRPFTSRTQTMEKKNILKVITLVKSFSSEHHVTIPAYNFTSKLENAIIPGKNVRKTRVGRGTTPW